MVKKGYRYFARTLSTEDTALIGSIAPKKIETSPQVAGGGSSAVAIGAATAAIGGGVGGGVAGAASAATPAQPAPAAASAWNSAGTWEERDVSSWAKVSRASRRLIGCLCRRRLLRAG